MELWHGMELKEIAEIDSKTPKINYQKQLMKITFL